jgi:hypothetical protein
MSVTGEGHRRRAFGEALARYARVAPSAAVRSIDSAVDNASKCGSQTLSGSASQRERDGHPRVLVALARTRRALRAHSSSRAPLALEVVDPQNRIIALAASNAVFGAVMVDLSKAVDDLVAAASREVPQRALRSTVEKVLDSFDEAAEDARTAALRSIGRAIGKVDGRGAQILSLALGALVEGGASPEHAWPAIGNNLTSLLDHATDFAAAAVEQSQDENVDTAIESAGAVVAKKKPREAEAWKALPSRCLAAVACLTRSKELRARVRKDHALHEAAWPLSDVVSEVGYLLQALRIVDDETLLVLAPDAGRGWRVTVDAMPSNADAKAVAAIREGAHPAKGPASVKVPFHLVAWPAVERDGSLPPADSHETEHWIWMEGIPDDIPVGAGKQRVVLLQDAPDSRPIPVAPSFESLRPDVRVTEELSSAEVERTMLTLGKAAAKTRPANAQPATTAAPAKKTTAAKESASKKAAPKTATPKKKATPKKATPKKATPKKATPKKTTPKKATPKKTTPKKTTPKKEAAPKKGAAPKHASRAKKSPPKKATRAKA